MPAPAPRLVSIPWIRCSGAGIPGDSGPGGGPAKPLRMGNVYGMIGGSSVGATTCGWAQYPIKGAFLYSDTTIDQDMIRAYLETEYRVEADVPLTLRIGTACPLLAAMHKAHRVECSTFITACNPFSTPFDDALNMERQAVLAKELTRRGLTFMEGIGQHPSNLWQGEPSFLVLGVSKEAAKALGTRHEQNALVWIGPSAVPELILLR